MSSDPQPISLNPPADAVPDDGGVAAALAEVRRLQEETKAKAAELDRALDRLRDLTEAGLDELEQRRPRVVPPRHEVPNDAVLRATRMAVAGSSREAIEAELREDFGITDPAAILDDVLGAERRPRG